MERLTWGAFALEKSIPTIRRGKAKRRVDQLPLSVDLVAKILQVWPKATLPTARVFPRPVSNVTRQRDFERAKIVAGGGWRSVGPARLGRPRNLDQSCKTRRAALQDGARTDDRSIERANPMTTTVEAQKRAQETEATSLAGLMSLPELPDVSEPEVVVRSWMERVRTRPRIWDYCYFTARTNLEVLQRAIGQAGHAPRVVDIGCGAKPFAPLFGSGTDYFGIDFDARTSADLVHDLGQPIPLPDGEADVVILSEAIEHVLDPELVLAEAARLLKPGGELFLSAPFAFPIHSRPWDFRRLTDYFYRRVGERHPLELVELEASNNVFSTPLLLCEQILLSAPGLPVALKRIGWAGFNAVAWMLERVASPWWRSDGRLGLFLRMNPSGYAMRFRRI